MCECVILIVLLYRNYSGKSNGEREQKGTPSTCSHENDETKTESGRNETKTYPQVPVRPSFDGRCGVRLQPARTCDGHYGAASSNALTERCPDNIQRLTVKTEYNKLQNETEKQHKEREIANFKHNIAHFAEEQRFLLTLKEVK